MNIIQLDNVSYSYADKHLALDGLSMSVKQGEIVSVIGSNGSGKSTLFHIIGGLMFSNTGEYRYKDALVNEKELKNENFNRRFRSSIGYVFQNPDSQLFCPTVLDELMFGPLQMGKDFASARERAAEVVDMLNIENLTERPTYMLSGGEKKRVAIGAVLTMNPDVLLFDEPMSGLDPKTRAFIIDLIFRLNELGKTILIATHHLEVVDHFQSRVMVLSEHHKLEKEGLANDILADTELLIRTNLIHENWHVHGHTKHKHLLHSSIQHKH